jgi:hypothetical protein
VAVAAPAAGVTGVDAAVGVVWAVGVAVAVAGAAVGAVVVVVVGAAVATAWAGAAGGVTGCGAIARRAASAPSRDGRAVT